MQCPECFDDELIEECAMGIEPHGECHEDTWFRCTDCGWKGPKEDALTEADLRARDGDDRGSLAWDEENATLSEVI